MTTAELRRRLTAAQPTTRLAATLAARGPIRTAAAAQHRSPGIDLTRRTA